MGDNLKVAIAGAGATSLAAAEAFGKKYPVMVYDTDPEKEKRFISSGHRFTTVPEELSEAGVLLVTGSKRPHYAVDTLTKLCNEIGPHIKKGAVLIFEAPVYPGTTEDICIPLLEKQSGLQAGKEFFVGFAPARWNAADPDAKKVRKVVAGQSGPVADYMADLFEPIHTGGIFKAKSIRVAEAAQLLEIAQLEVNTALINEIALSLNQQNIDTFDVLETANTKRGFMHFEPDLLEVDSKRWPPGAKWWIHPSGNGRELAHRIVKRLIQNEVVIHQSRITVLGMHQAEGGEKSGLLEMVRELFEYGIEIQLADSYLEEKGMGCAGGYLLTPEQELKPGAAVILAIARDSYKEAGWKLFEKLLEDKEGYVFDLNSLLPRSEKPEKVNLWRI